MNIGSLGNAAGAAGLPLAQAKGTELERARQAIGAQRRQVYHEKKAEAAAGVGEPDGEDHETSERDGDGRRPWDEPVDREGLDATTSQDTSRPSGNLLDLIG